MNKTYNINVGGYPFTIDEDAFQHLEDYLDTIENYFRQTEGGDEIIEDIEQRMAELLQERTKTKIIISRIDVEEVISILGSPADFGEFDQAHGYESDSESGREYKTGRRLFRDPDDQMIGGVCSGLAAYFGIEEVIWVRVAFAIAGFGAGIGVPLYLLLWAIVPEAKTPKDFLAMRGEPINVKNIAKVVEEQVEHISDQLSDLGSEWKEKRRKKKSRRRDRR